MAEVQGAMSAAAYAAFALQQPLTLEELAVAADDTAFPFAAAHTPDGRAEAGRAESPRTAQPVEVSDEELARLRAIAPELGAVGHDGTPSS